MTSEDQVLQPDAVGSSRRPPPPGVRVDAYPAHYPIAITAQIVDIGDPDRWRLFIRTWTYDHVAGKWERMTSDDGLTQDELRRVLEHVAQHAPGVLP
jgi:hypothetical protein